MNENAAKKDSLEDFINDNDKLLSVLGVFVAVVALTVGSINWALNAVAFVSIGGIILLGYTILAKIDKKSHSLQLQLFRYIILWGGTAFIIYWVSEFRLVWNLVLWIPATVAIYALVVLSLLPIIKKNSAFCFLLGIGSEKRKWFQNLFRVTSSSVAFFVSLYMGIWISVGTNLFFDTISKFHR